MIDRDLHLYFVHVFPDSCPRLHLRFHRVAPHRIHAHTHGLSSCAEADVCHLSHLARHEGAWKTDSLGHDLYRDLNVRGRGGTNHDRPHGDGVDEHPCPCRDHALDHRDPYRAHSPVPCRGTSHDRVLGPCLALVRVRVLGRDPCQYHGEAPCVSCWWWMRHLPTRLPEGALFASSQTWKRQRDDFLRPR